MFEFYPGLPHTIAGTDKGSLGAWFSSKIVFSVQGVIFKGYYDHGNKDLLG